MNMKISIMIISVLFAPLSLAEQHDDSEKRHGCKMQNKMMTDDGRQFVKMPPMMRQHMLSNMRDHLAAMNDILQLMGQGELDKAADVAEQRLGMSAMKGHGGGKMAKHMPEGMRDIGSAMHHAASRFALKAQEGDAVLAYQVLSEVTASCVACHASYRIH